MTTSDISSTQHATIRTLLVEAATGREKQLAALAPFDGDLVAEAHRASVTRILTEIRTAITALDAGTYGTCTRCTLPIPPARLELLPWTARCVRCAAM